MARLKALEEKVIEVETPEAEDVKAYREAERKIKEGKLLPFRKV